MLLPLIPLLMPMPQFKKLIEDLTALDFEKEMQEIVSDHTDDITELLKVQMAAGKGGDNEPVTLDGKDEYAPATIEYKEKYGQGLGGVTDRITTYQTGELYRSLVTKTEGNVFDTEATVPYFADVVARTGSQLMDLDDDSRKQFGQQITLPEIQDRLYAKTGLQISI